MHTIEKPTILIFDDQKTIAGCFQELATQSVLQCKHSNSTIDFYSIVEKERPDLLLVDAQTLSTQGLSINKLSSQSKIQLPPTILILENPSIADRVNGLESGAIDIICTPASSDEVVARTLVAIRKKQYQDALEHNSQIEPVTGLWNHSHFEKRLQERIGAFQRYGRIFSLIFIEIDLGSSVFDEPLQQRKIATIGEMLKCNSRTDDIASYFGNGVFVLLLAETGEAGCRVALERLYTLLIDENDQHQKMGINLNTAILPHSQIENLMSNLTVQQLLGAGRIALKRITNGNNGSNIEIVCHSDFTLSTELMSEKEKQEVEANQRRYYQHQALIYDHQELFLLAEQGETINVLRIMMEQLEYLLDSTNSFLVTKQNHFSCQYAAGLCTCLRECINRDQQGVINKVIETRKPVEMICNQNWHEAFPGATITIAGRFLLTPLLSGHQVVVIIGFFFPDDDVHGCTNATMARMPRSGEAFDFAHIARVCGYYSVLGSAILAESYQRTTAEIELKEWRNLEQDLHKAKLKAEHDNLSKSTFLANMSHELRTPLNAIIGFGELMLEDAVDEDKKDFVPDLEKIISAGHHLLRLINNVLDLSKVEVGKSQLYLDNVDVVGLVQSVINIVSPLIEKNNNQLKYEYSDLPKSLYLDQTKLQQILINLLGNAAKFTHDGVVNLCVRGEQRDGKELIVFVVADTGIGMTMTQISKLFMPFTQADCSTTRKYGGTGLGLAIVKSFCEMMGGNIDVHSDPGMGATFTMTLPCRLRTAKSEFLLPKQPTVRQSSPHILLISQQQELTIDISSLENFYIQTIGTLQYALNQILLNKPDIILLDSLVPGNHHRFLHALFEEKLSFSLPVLLIIEKGSEQNLQNQVSAIFIDYLIRPFSLLELQARIRTLLQTKQLMNVLEERAQMDVLTSLWNYAHYLTRLEERTSLFRRYAHHFSVVAIRVADLMCHCLEQGKQEQGNQVLMVISDVLIHACRICDIPCRVGLNEFAIILPETQKRGLDPFIRRILKNIEAALKSIPVLSKIIENLHITVAAMATDQFDDAKTVTTTSIIEMLRMSMDKEQNDDSAYVIPDPNSFQKL